MKYFFHIAYDGSKYSGWQWQPNSFSVQGVIEQCLEKIFKEKITVFGCGRTDKGVHASQYFFHIEVRKEFHCDLKFVLEKHLPSTISLFEIIKVEGRKHARYDAKKRTYDYFLHTISDPFLDKYSSLFNEELDINLMKSATLILSKYSDFRGFCLQPDSHNHTLCKVFKCDLIINKQQNRIQFTITGDRFLKGMIRILISILLKIGKKEMSIVNFELLLKNPENGFNLKPAPPNGLYLSRIEYDYLKLKNQSVFF
jgi:tRNA pseudouridine38-40 synthase